MESVGGEMQPVHEGVSVLINGQRLSGKWVYQAIGPRQFKELEGRMIERCSVENAA